MGRKAKHIPPSIVLSDDDTPDGPILETEAPSLERDGSQVCDSTPDDDNTKEEEAPAVPEEAPVIKKKRQLTLKQIEALTAGRNKGMELKKASKIITTERNEVLSKVKELKKLDQLEGKREAVAELTKYVEAKELKRHISDLNGKIDSISTQFNTYLTDKEQRKADKQNNVLENTVRDAVPRAVSKLIYEDRLRQEQSKYNPFLGKV